jgi:hypothetical protein
VKLKLWSKRAVKQHFSRPASQVWSPHASVYGVRAPMLGVGPPSEGAHTVMKENSRGMIRLGRHDRPELQTSSTWQSSNEYGSGSPQLL